MPSTEKLVERIEELEHQLDQRNWYIEVLEFILKYYKIDSILERMDHPWIKRRY